MERFLRRVSIFGLLFIAYMLIMWTANNFWLLDKNVHLKGVHTLIIGDSHTRTSLNPDFFEASRNVSQTAEPYFITFWKLKVLLETNPIDTVLIGFGYHNLSAFNDRKLIDKEWAREMFRRYYPIAQFSSLKNLDIDHSKYYMNYVRKMCLIPVMNHGDWIGKYDNSGKNNLDDYELAINRHFYQSERNAGISTVQVNYLDSIISTCRENGVTPFLVANPLHNNYYSRIPKNFMKQFNETKKRLSDQGIAIFDLSLEPYADRYFLDSNHLNTLGAEKFSKEIRKRIKEKGQQPKKLVSID